MEFEFHHKAIKQKNVTSKNIALIVLKSHEFSLFFFLIVSGRPWIFKNGFKLFIVHNLKSRWIDLNVLKLGVVVVKRVLLDVVLSNVVKCDGTLLVSLILKFEWSFPLPGKFSTQTEKCLLAGVYNLGFLKVRKPSEAISQARQLQRYRRYRMVSHTTYVFKCFVRKYFKSPTTYVTYS